LKSRLLTVVALALVALLVGACSAPYHRPGCDYTEYWASIYWGVNYGIDARDLRYTPKNIAVDPSGQPVDLARIDRLTDETLDCLAAAFPDGVIPGDVIHDAWCSSTLHPVDRACLTVKVVDDWFIGKSGDQLLPHGNGGGCEDKGLGPGPCFWRAAIQPDRIVVVPPEMKLYKEMVVRLSTTASNPWGSKVLAACMTAQ
jgi:hypothetical protein